jgi:hypothetical protein
VVHLKEANLLLGEANRVHDEWRDAHDDEVHKPNRGNDENPKRVWQNANQATGTDDAEQTANSENPQEERHLIDVLREDVLMHMKFLYFYTFFLSFFLAIQEKNSRILRILSFFFCLQQKKTGKELKLLNHFF